MMASDVAAQTDTLHNLQVTDKFQFNWFVNSTRQSMWMQLTVSCNCWVSVGWHPANAPDTDDGMTNCDMVNGVFTGGVSERNNEHFQNPKEQSFDKSLLLQMNLSYSLPPFDSRNWLSAICSRPRWRRQNWTPKSAVPTTSCPSQVHRSMVLQQYHSNVI
jgi:hypothetical protein